MEAKPITKNLYREDEVVAALRYSIAQGDSVRALFWVQEGLESNMDVIILQTLLITWLYSVGLGNLSWFGWFLAGLEEETAFTEESIIALTLSLVDSVRDCRIFNILALGLEQTTETVKFTVLPVAFRNKGLTKDEVTFVRAIQQEKFQLAWSLAGPMWATGRAEEILQVMESPQFPVEKLGALYSEKFVWPFRALSLLCAHSKGILHRPIEPAPAVPGAIMSEWELRKTIPMRYRRIYAVPPECLFPYTARGLAPVVSTDLELTHFLEKSMNCSTYWNGFASEYMSGGRRREKFYDSQYLNDIPDEWSLAARAKSHGTGAICDLATALRRFFGDDAAIEGLVAKNLTEACFHYYYSRGSTWSMDNMKNALEAMFY
jgi:hypothetical protein